MDIGKLVTGLTVSSFLAISPSYALPAPETPSPSYPIPSLSAQELSVSAHAIADVVLTRFPHPQAHYVCRSDALSELCIVQLTLTEGRYIVSVKNNFSIEGARKDSSSLSLFYLGSDKNAKPQRQNLRGMYDLNKEKVIIGNPLEFDQDLARIVNAYAPLLLPIDGCEQQDI